MATMNISLTPELARFVEQEVSAGRYVSASELVREGLRLLEWEKEVAAEKQAILKAAVQLGLDDEAAGRLSDKSAREIAEEVLHETEADAT